MVVLDKLIDENDDDMIYYCFDALNLLAENKQTILDGNLTNIIEYLCGNKVLGNQKLSKKVKESVLDLIYTVSEFHKQIFNKN